MKVAMLTIYPPNQIPITSLWSCYTQSLEGSERYGPSCDKVRAMFDKEGDLGAPLLVMFSPAAEDGAHEHSP